MWVRFPPGAQAEWENISMTIESRYHLFDCFLDDPELGLDSGTSYFRDGKYKDVDAASPRLYCCHELLWSGELPNGENLRLVFCRESDNRFMLKDENFPLPLTSDTISRSHSKLDNLLQSGVISKEEANGYLRASRSIGSFLIWPIRGDKGNPWNTVNIVRARTVNDRIDLTLWHLKNCYEKNWGEDERDELGKPIGLYKTFKLYRSWFELFKTFKGFVDFFHLQDFVNEGDYSVQLFAETTAIRMGSDLELKYVRWLLDKISARDEKLRTLFAYRQSFS
jgi:hypothetical protein